MEAFLIVLVVLALMWIIPIRSKVLIEGRYRGEIKNAPIGRRRIFIFEDFCRKCFDEWRDSGREPEGFDEYCYASVPTKSFDISSVRRPESGAIYKITGWLNIFGRIQAYSVDSSDYIWVDPREEKLRIEGLKAGYSDVNEYKAFLARNLRERMRNELMEQHGLTQEDAELFESVRGMIWFSLDKEAKRTGSSVAEIIDRQIHPVRTSDCKLELNVEFHARDFVAGKSLPESVTGHLNNCSSCNGSFWVWLGIARDGSSDDSIDSDKLVWLLDYDVVRAREEGISIDEFRERARVKRILRYGGPDCYTLKERAEYARTAKLVDIGRASHADSCIGCKRMIESDREDFVRTGKVGTT